MRKGIVLEFNKAPRKSVRERKSTCGNCRVVYLKPAQQKTDESDLAEQERVEIEGRTYDPSRFFKRYWDDGWQKDWSND